MTELPSRKPDALPDGTTLDLETIRTELTTQRSSTGRRALEKFVLAALGSIPWVGAYISAAASLKFEEPGIRHENLQTQWLEGHHHKLEQLKDTLEEAERRFDSLGESIDERLESEEYLSLVRSAFRAWDQAETDEKRRYVANLITNAAGTRLCSDDVIRLFIDWLDQYHEVYFAVIREIHQHPGCTRYDMWKSIYREFPREDSAEADLFKLLIRDLSTGGVIRQERLVTEGGEFLKSPKTHRPGGKAPPTLESAFEGSKPYVLTALGSQFVHYTMNELVPRLE